MPANSPFDQSAKTRDQDPVKLARAQAAGFRDISFTTVFHMQKGNGPQQTEFPIFLMVARKPSR